MKNNYYSMNQNHLETYINNHQKLDYVQGNSMKSFSIPDFSTEEEYKDLCLQNDPIKIFDPSYQECEKDSLENFFGQYMYEEERENLYQNPPANPRRDYNDDFQINHQNESVNFQNLYQQAQSQGQANNLIANEIQEIDSEKLNEVTQDYLTPTPTPEEPEDEMNNETPKKPIKKNLPPFIIRKDKKKGRPPNWLGKPNGNRSDNMKRTVKKAFISNLEEFVLKKFIKSKTRSGKLIPNLKKINKERWSGVKNTTNYRFFELEVKDLYYITNTKNKKFNAIWKKYKVDDDHNKKALDKIFLEKKEINVIEIMHKKVKEVYEIYLGIKTDKDGFYYGFNTLEDEMKKSKYQNDSLERKEIFYKLSYEIFEEAKIGKNLIMEEDSEEERTQNFVQ